MKTKKNVQKKCSNYSNFIEIWLNWTSIECIFLCIFFYTHSVSPSHHFLWEFCSCRILFEIKLNIINEWIEYCTECDCVAVFLCEKRLGGWDFGVYFRVCVCFYIWKGHNLFHLKAFAVWQGEWDRYIQFLLFVFFFFQPITDFKINFPN